MSTQTDTGSLIPFNSDTLPEPIIRLPHGLTIRPYHASDRERTSYHGNNRKIWLNMTERFPHPYTPDDFDTWITICYDPANYLSTARPPARFKYIPSISASTSLAVQTKYAICLSDEPIGGIGIDSMSAHPHNLEMGYWMGELHWGRGFGTLVARAFLEWTFDTFPWCLRVSATAYAWNPASVNVLRKLGMQYEGRQKMAVYRDGKYTDLVMFGIVRPGFVPESYTGESDEMMMRKYEDEKKTKDDKFDDVQNLYPSNDE